jgi:hypothetical protein
MILSLNLIVQCLGDSERYIRRGNDKTHRRRLKGGERIFKAYQFSPMDVLEVIDKDHLLFHVKSETSPTLWYSVSLKTHYCNCPDIVSTCKHIFGVQAIVKEFFERPKINEVVEEALPMLPEMEDIDITIPSQMDVPIEEVYSSGVMHKKVLHTLNEIDSLCRVSLQDHNEEEVRRIHKVLQVCLTSLLEPSTFDRPNVISLPKRGSIASIQENVKRTRMGHGKKRVISEIGEGSTPRPPLKRPSHMLLSHSKQKRAIFRKLPKVTCDICATKTLVEGGANSIFCKNCDYEIFVK